jgi:putative transposase
MIAYATILLLLTSVVKVYGDQGYRGLSVWLSKITDGQTEFEVVYPPADRVGFGIDPKRWIVERSFSWLGWSRRLSKDYEQTRQSSEAWLDVSAIRTALGKLLK